jgi:hypothetical protein
MTQVFMAAILLDLRHGILACGWQLRLPKLLLPRAVLEIRTLEAYTSLAAHIFEAGN